MSRWLLLSSVAIGTACSAVNVGSDGRDCVRGRFLTGEPGVVIVVYVVYVGKARRGGLCEGLKKGESQPKRVGLGNGNDRASTSTSQRIRISST